MALALTKKVTDKLPSSSGIATRKGKKIPSRSSFGDENKKIRVHSGRFNITSFAGFTKKQKKLSQNLNTKKQGKVKKGVNPNFFKSPSAVFPKKPTKVSVNLPFFNLASFAKASGFNTDKKPQKTNLHKRKSSIFTSKQKPKTNTSKKVPDTISPSNPNLQNFPKRPDNSSKSTPISFPFFNLASFAKFITKDKTKKQGKSESVFNNPQPPSQKTPTEPKVFSPSKVEETKQTTLAETRGVFSSASESFSNFFDSLFDVSPPEPQDVATGFTTENTGLSDEISDPLDDFIFGAGGQAGDTQASVTDNQDSFIDTITKDPIKLGLAVTAVALVGTVLVGGKKR